jgi:hypothetical protein
MSVVAKWDHSKEYWQEFFHESATVHRSKTTWKFLAFVIVGILVAVSINIITPFYYKFYVEYFMKGFSAALFLTVGYYYVSLYLSRKQFMNSYQKALPGEAIFSAESFTFKTQNTDSIFKWGAVTDLISSKRGLIVYLRGGGVIYVPEASIEDHDGKSKILSMYEKATAT